MTPEPAVRFGYRSQLFALTIFCGSFLLFLVQPIIAKELLPHFGGSASVWLTCLVFFQVALLVGYAGADRFAMRVAPRAQIALVVVLVLAAVLTLPIMPSAHGATMDASPDPTRPALGVLASLGLTVGLPYVLVSATTPVVQSWYSRSLAGRSPMDSLRCPTWPPCWRCSVIRSPWSRGSAHAGRRMAGRRPSWSGRL